MIVDWAVSLFAVTLIVFGLIVVTEVEFVSVEHTYAAQTVTGSVAELIANKVSHVEGIEGSTTELFTFGNSYAGAIVLPPDLNGRPYTLDFTHDYVIVLTTGGTPVGTAMDFWQPVYLFNLTTVNTLGNQPINGSVLASMSNAPAGTCQGFVSGTNFIATHERALVDGQYEYLTIISSADGLDHGC